MTSTAYDAVSYPCAAYPQTHPNRLATIATLFGMSPAPAEHCRVLEIGCSDGGNLIPMAFTLPGSSFTGIDLAARPIAAGRATVERLGLRNITLLQQDLAAPAGELGSFDYIIAHGIYAWVAPALQDRLLAVCGAQLMPQGVAFVSYNAYPGARIREMLRDMMLYHLRPYSDPKERIDEAKGLLRFLTRSWPEANDLRHWIGKVAEVALKGKEGTLYHDELNEDYRPAYFHEFVDHAARHGMQYLGEAEFFAMNDGSIPAEALETLRRFGPEDFIQKEQYLDFLRCRMFRQTLLCRREIALTREVPSDILHRFLVETRAHPAGRARDPASGGEEEYQSSFGAKMATKDEVIQKLMARLEQAWPKAVAFRDLVGPGLAAAELAGFVLRMFGSGLVDLHLNAPPFTLDPGERPEASRLARMQLEDRPRATSLRHADLFIESPQAQSLIRLLDGTRDRAALLRDLAGLGVPATADGLEDSLRQLARLALFPAPGSPL
jgi:SAM-dependent methyltransferase